MGRFLFSAQHSRLRCSALASSEASHLCIIIRCQAVGARSVDWVAAFLSAMPR